MIDTYWRNKQVAVTGGAGFLGSYVVVELKSGGRRREYDLRRLPAVERLLAAAYREW